MVLTIWNFIITEFGKTAYISQGEFVNQFSLQAYVQILHEHPSEIRQRALQIEEHHFETVQSYVIEKSQNVGSSSC